MLAICGAQLGMSIEVGDQRHRADAEGEPEQRHADRQPHRDERTEREQQDDDRGDQADHLADASARLLEGEEQVATHLDLERRVRRSSVGDELLEVRRGRPASSSSITGYWTRTSATRPSARDRPARRRGLGPGGERAGRIARADHVAGAPRRRLCTSASAARASGESKNVAPSSSGRDDDLGGQAGLIGLRVRQQVDGALRVEPRHLEGVLELAAEARRRPRSTTTATSEPGSDDGPRAAGGEPSESVESV